MVIFYLLLIKIKQITEQENILVNNQPLSYQNIMLTSTEPKDVGPSPHLEDIRNPERVRVLVLTGQKLSSQQFIFLRTFNNLIKLDLSHNRISTFSQGFSFKPFTQLKTLFLHYNKFDRLKSIDLLSDCNKLVYLTLFGNPIQESEVRHFCVNSIRSLKFMDDKAVSQEERYTGILNLTQKNQPYIRSGFPLIEMPNPQNDLQFLSSMIRQISIAKDLYLKANPIIVIQKWWKSKLAARKTNKRYLYKEQNVQMKTKNEMYRYQQNDLKTGRSDSSIKNSSQKILTLFKIYLHGIKLLELLYNEDPSILCTKQYCLQNNYKFKQSQRFNHKFLTIYTTPQNHTKYSQQKEKSKKFHSLAFYNNSHYILELNYKVKVNKKAQLKNISGKQQQSQLNQFVQIDLPNSQKLRIIKKEYFKSKISQTSQPFQLLFGLYIIKISSAIKIQKIWKGYLVRRSLNLLRIIREEKSAKKIQKWLRNLKFYHRQNFLLKAYELLKNNDTSNIVMTLEQFSKIKFYDRQKSVFGKLFKLPFQNFQFQMMERTNYHPKIGEQQELISKHPEKLYKIILNSQRQPFPMYFQKFVKSFDLSNQITTDSKKFKHKSLQIRDLLIKGAIQIKKFCKVTLSKDNKKEQKMYVKFEFQDKNEANQRKLLLYLLTYSFKTQTWLQFHSQPTQTKVNSIDVQSQIKKNQFIKIIFDNNKKQNLFEKLKDYTKQTNHQGVLNWYPIKIRYYQGTTNNSGILLCGVHKINDNVEERDKNEGSNGKNYEQKKKLRQLRSLKTLNAKIALENFDTRIIMPTKRDFNPNESIMAFSVPLKNQQNNENQQKIYQRQQLKEYPYFHTLNRDNSKFLMDDSLALTKNVKSSYGLSSPLSSRKRTQENQIDDLTISTNPQMQRQMQRKRSNISKTKQIHKSKLNAINQFKQKNRNSIRMENQTQKQKNHQLIRQKSHSSLAKNLDMIKKIQQTRKIQIQQSSELQKFQNKFLRNGNLSIQNQLRQYQKNRSRSKKKINKSARYGDQQRENQKSSMAKNFFKQSINKEVLKTELKQFSINFSQSGDLQSSHIGENEQRSQKNEIRRETLRSAVSQKITKIYEQKKKQFLKSESKEQNQSMKPISNFEQTQKKIEDEKRKQLRKKRTVHSVFPEEFFPLKDSQQIGFHLPKINSYKY